MPIRNGRTITIGGPHADAVELPGKRWETGACFANPDGTRTYTVFGSPIHYHDGAVWQEIDNRWQAGVAPWNYEMTACQYQAFALSRFDAGRILRLEKSGHYVTYQPMALNWTNDLDQIQQIAMPANVQAVATNGGLDSLCPNGRLDWAAAYGAGLDFTYTPSTHFLKKELTVDTLARLGTPAAYIIAGGNPVLALSFIFATDLDLWIDGAKWDKKSQKSSVNNIEFRDAAGVVHWWWRTPTATDSADGPAEPIRGSIQVKKQGASLYVSVLVPYAWLAAAVYPVRVDPTSYYGATTDGQIRGQNSTYATCRDTSTDLDVSGISFYLGQRWSTFYQIWRSYIEIDTSGIADTDTVTQANLYLTVSSNYMTYAFTRRVHKYDWESPIAAGNRETNYDGALASTYDADWPGESPSIPTASSNLDTTWIKKLAGEKTRYTLLSSKDVSSTAPTGREFFIIHSQEATTEAYRPYLAVTVAAAGGVPKQANHYARMRRS